MIQDATTPIVKIAANVNWEIAQDPDSGLWIGVCDALRLNADGETFQELQECMSEAMELLFLDLYEEGDLEEFLHDHGWTMQEPATAAPAASRPRFDVPYTHHVTELPDLMAALA